LRGSATVVSLTLACEGGRFGKGEGWEVGPWRGEGTGKRGLVLRSLGFGLARWFRLFGGICVSRGCSLWWAVALLLLGIVLPPCTYRKRTSTAGSLSRCRWLTTQAATPLPTLTGWIIPKPPPRLDRGGLLGDSSLPTLFCSLGLIRL